MTKNCPTWERHEIAHWYCIVSKVCVLRGYLMVPSSNHVYIHTKKFVPWEPGKKANDNMAGCWPARYLPPGLSDTWQSHAGWADNSNLHRHYVENMYVRVPCRNPITYFNHIAAFTMHYFWKYCITELLLRVEDTLQRYGYSESRPQQKFIDTALWTERSN